MLAQKQTHGSEGQTRSPETTPTATAPAPSAQEARPAERQGRVESGALDAAWRPTQPHTTHRDPKCLKGLNLRHDTIKLLGESKGKSFSDINHTNVLLGQCPNIREIKEK